MFLGDVLENSINYRFGQYHIETGERLLRVRALHRLERVSDSTRVPRRSRTLTPRPIRIWLSWALTKPLASALDRLLDYRGEVLKSFLESLFIIIFDGLN